jgi:hypothetical protein
MKKLTTLLLLSLLFFNCISQQTNPSPSLTKQDYLKKSKKEKTTAWILAGGGLAMSAVTLTIAANQSADATNNFLATLLSLAENNGTTVTHDFSVLGVLFYIGAAGTIASIPMFVSSSKDKRKAMSMSFSNQALPQICDNSFVHHAIPSIKLKISL